LTEPAAFGPYSFALTDDEARAAASRIALHSNLARRFERDYVAPLVVFVLFLVFVVVLAFSGLIGRRAAEAALLIGAIAFMTTRFLAHWRLRRAQKFGRAMVARTTALQNIRMSVDDDGVRLDCADAPGVPCAFKLITQADDAGGVIYLWRRDDDAPVIIPARIFMGEDEAKQFVAFVRTKISAR
jgi:hypothetical protein